MRVRTRTLTEMKQEARRIPCVTAYDYPTARLADAAGFPLILVGDSLGNVVLGHDSTIAVTLDAMVHHTQAVARGVEHALVVADMPFMTYQASAEDALRNAARLMQEGGAHAVKVEGGESIAITIERMTAAGVPVMGHLGLTPQSVHQLGGFRVQGRSLADAKRLIADALRLQQAGVFAVVLETVPAELSRIVTERLAIPTIGIGAGPHCDGEIQVLHEILGLIEGRPRKHAKTYALLNALIADAFAAYAADVRERRFPTEANSFDLDEGVLEALRAEEDAPGGGDG
ncbi:MAG: 3-methyl-2-oxobutanoate hydroxymethyltransferase [Chloroflexota bacterium]|nr:3-methyl-2-oxobutanoate hydroxymethyltransferase [Chloroflexota bacterium]